MHDCHWKHIIKHADLSVIASNCSARYVILNLISWVANCITDEEPKKPNDNPEPTTEEQTEEKMEEDDDALDLVEDKQKEKTPDKTADGQVLYTVDSVVLDKMGRVSSYC